jgi:hypothetical protein
MKFHKMPMMGLPPNHFEPFRNNTFRCHRCGSSAGPNCRCMDFEKVDKLKYSKPEPIKIDPPVTPKFEYKPTAIDLNIGLKKKRYPWE